MVGKNVFLGVLMPESSSTFVCGLTSLVPDASPQPEACQCTLTGTMVASGKPYIDRLTLTVFAGHSSSEDAINSPVAHPAALVVSARNACDVSVTALLFCPCEKLYGLLCYGYIVTVDRSCTFGNALVSIGTSITGSSPPSALYSFSCPELAIIHKANTVSTTGDLLLLLTSHLQGLHYRCSGSITELGTDREAAIIRSVAVLCRLGPWNLPLCAMHTKLRVLPHEWLETTQTHIDIGSASIPSLPIRMLFLYVFFSFPQKKRCQTKP